MLDLVDPALVDLAGVCLRRDGLCGRYKLCMIHVAPFNHSIAGPGDIRASSRA